MPNLGVTKNSLKNMSLKCGLSLTKNLPSAQIQALNHTLPPLFGLQHMLKCRKDFLVPLTAVIFSHELKLRCNYSMGFYGHR